MPCGGRKKSPRTSSIVQIIFYFGPLRSVKIFRVFKTLTFRNLPLSNFLIIDPIKEYVFDLDSSCKFSKLQHNYSLAFVAGLKRATDEGSLPEIAQYSPYYLPLNVFTASKGSNLYILFITMAYNYWVTLVSVKENHFHDPLQ